MSFSSFQTSDLTKRVKKNTAGMKVGVLGMSMSSHQEWEACKRRDNSSAASMENV